jgi:hypothetical protein
VGILLQRIERRYLRSAIQLVRNCRQRRSNPGLNVFLRFEQLRLRILQAFERSPALLDSLEAGLRAVVVSAATAHQAVGATTLIAC